MTNKEKQQVFIDEYEKICKKYSILIDSCGWGHLTLIDYLSKKEFSKCLEEHIEYYKSKMNLL